MYFKVLFFSFAAVVSAGMLKIDFNHSTVITNSVAALGGGIDGHEKGSTRDMLASTSVKKMLQAGLKPLAYRLRTELGVEAWHWNSVGTWSDAAHQQGYWTSSTDILDHSSRSVPFINVSYGYRLPRRGDTLDEANNDGYSRLDDGNPKTFWKSNPYLTSHYTGEPDWKHPQWVIIDFGKKVWINAARLHWREPYAKKFRIQYANDGAVYFGNNKPWHDFPKGVFNNGRGGADLLDLGMPRDFFGKSTPVRYVRILLLETRGQQRGQQRGQSLTLRILVPSHKKSNELAPNTAISGTDPFVSGTDPFAADSCGDPRDQMGYALQEVELGFFKEGKFEDHVIHRPDQKQTMITVSSTDPWHRASDLDEKTEQPGIDTVVASTLDNDQPILWSLPVLYDTPENAAALVSYLKKRNYLKPHQRIELGEEPDGQHIDPKDFGELYSQVAEKVQSLFLKSLSCSSAVDWLSILFPRRPEQSRTLLHGDSSNSSPQLVLGGPSFVTADYQPKDTTYRFDHRLWLKPFFQQLRRHHQEKNFQFLTFEWYPCDDLLLPAPNLLRKASGRLRRAMNLLRRGGVPKKMPMIITEYGYSVFSGEPEVKIEAALLNAEIACEFLSSEGSTAYLYGYEPNTVECGINGSWGNLMMLLNQNSSVIPLPTFYGAQMVTSLLKKETQIFPVKTSQHDLTAYAFHEKNSLQWDLLLINKNRTQSYQIDRILRVIPFEKISYSSVNYCWHADGPNGSPSKNKPPQHDMIPAGASVMIEPWSLTILKTKMD